MLLSRFLGRSSALLIILLMALPSFAQTSFGRISGTITDPGGAVITNAPVLVRNVDTQVTRTVHSNDSGFYSATDLANGTYSILIQQPGFESRNAPASK